MYCKKCGTKQQDGQKFCPKCGTPYPVITQEVIECVGEEHKEEEIVAIKESSPQNTQQKNLQEEITTDISSNKTKMEASYSEQQNENEEKNEWTRMTRIFENSSGEGPSQTVVKAKIALYLGLGLIFGPFIINGFSFGFFWYLLIIGVAFFTFLVYGIDGKREGEAKFVKNILVGFCIVLVVMLEWGPLDPNYSSSSSMSSNNSEYNYSGSGQNVEKTLLTCRKCHRQFYANGVIDLCENCRLRKQAHQDVMKDREEFGW